MTKPSDITPREREILELTAQGMTCAEVGQALYITENTVKTHLRRIKVRAKLSGHVTATINWAWQNGHIGDRMRLLEENVRLRNEVDVLRAMYRAALQHRPRGA